MTSIKYHQNGIGTEYGLDGHLTDNWNPAKDYKNEYVKVYFRINTPSYDTSFSFRFNPPEARERFYNEASTLLKSFGIMEDGGYTVEHSNNKYAYLYVHPQNISGVIKKNDVQKIAEAIDKMETCSIRWVDLYETVYVISDEEYSHYLDRKRGEIRRELFNRAATTRTNKFYSAYDVARSIAGTVRIHRLGLNDEQTIDYILMLLMK